MASNYNLIYKLIADDKQFKTGFDRATKTLDRHADSVKRTGNSYNKMQGTMRKLNDVARNAALRFGEGSKEFKQASAAALTYKKRLDSVDASMRKAGLTSQKMSQKGGLGSSIMGVAMKRILPLLAISTVARGLANAGRVFADFEATLSEVEGISGATSKELVILSDQAERLGRTTQRTATDVLRLQVELSKLGFTAIQIEQATASVLALSVATRTDLGEAAQVVASTLKAFHLSATETQMVVDTMSKAFVSSALNMEKFKVGMAILAPAAYTAGLSIQGATAALGVLADNGLDASMAGTSLRNIFLELSMKGLDLDKVLNEIANSSNKAGAAQKYFQKRSASAAIILSQNQDQLIELASKTYMAEGATQKLADTMADNLKGDIELAKSAWQGFILSIEDGNGVINSLTRGSLRIFAKALERISYLIGGTEGQGKILGFDAFEGDLEKSTRAVTSELGSFNEEYAKFVDEAKKQELTFSEFVKKSTEFRNKFRKREQEIRIETLEKQLQGALNYEKQLYANNGGIVGISSNEDALRESHEYAERIRLLRAELTKLKSDSVLFTDGFNVDIGVGGGDKKPEREDADKIVTKFHKVSTALENVASAAGQAKNNMISLFDFDAAMEFEEFEKGLNEIAKSLTESPTDLTISKIPLTEQDMKLLGLTESYRFAMKEFDTIGREFLANGTFELINSAMDDFISAMNSTDGFDNFGSGILAAMGAFIESFGQMLVQQGLLTLAATTLATNPATAPLAIGIGLAAMAIGKQMSAKAGGSMLSGTHGGGSMPSVPNVKACDGYSQYTQGYGGDSTSSGRSSSGGGQVEFVIKGNNLVGVLEKTERRNQNFR